MTKEDLKSHLLMWDNRESAKYAATLCKYYGMPDYYYEGKKGYPAGICWINVAGVHKVKVVDEALAHDFPVEHADFVYSTMYIEVPVKFVGALAKVTGSILVDTLKGEVTARCGKLIKNAVTLQFVKDVVEGNAKPTKAEYGKRIKKNSPMIGYNDALGESENITHAPDMEEAKKKAMFNVMSNSIGQREY